MQTKMASSCLISAFLICFTFQNIISVYCDIDDLESEIVVKLLQKFEMFQLKMDKLVKSEKDMKASVSALIGTNVQFRIQIHELTEKIEYLEKENTDKTEKIADLEKNLVDYGDVISDNCQKYTKPCDDEMQTNVDYGIIDTDTDTDHDTDHETNTDIDTEQKKQKTTNRNQKRGKVKKGTRQVSGQVAFSAYLDHPAKTLGKDQPIVYNVALLNDGNAYSLNTGIFRVPTPGIYLFSWASTARKLPGEPSYDIWIHLVVNGLKQVGSVAESRADGDDNQGSNTVVIRVSDGDEVWTSHSNGYPYIYGADNERTTSFMGVLLYEEE